MTNISTLNDFLTICETEVAEIKNGKLPYPAGRIVQKYRKLQLEGASLNLQYQRLIRQGNGRVPFASEAPIFINKKRGRKPLNGS